MLEVNNLTVDYGGLRALDNASIRIDAGETVAVVGSNGSGKSTLFKAISAVVAPTSGSIKFDGIDLASKTASERAQLGIAHVPEGRRVFGSMTVEDNLILGAMGSSKTRERLTEVYEMFPLLAEHRRRQASQLSGGQQQMLALGRGLISHPRLLMLDEPSMGLAPGTADMIFERIEALGRSGDMAILLVEQRAAEALEIVDRGYLLDTGKVVAEGSGDSLRKSDLIRDTYLGMTGQAK